ncbi:MAG: hypothetical protein ACOC53_02545 [Candidatus Saliniplasma sp.]
MDIHRIKRKIIKRKVLLTGLGLISIALLLAFVSINVTFRTFESQEKSLKGDGDSEALESRFQSINSSLEMEFNPANQGDDNSRGEVTVIIIHGGKNETYDLEYEENKTIELEDDANFIVSDFDSSRGNITFSQTIVYETQPYGLFSIPAFVLTIISLVLVYSGMHRMKIEKKLDEQEEKLEKVEEPGKELSPPEQKFMGVDWGKKE